MDHSEKRRRRPPLACTLCRTRKIRCDRKTPCENCIRSKGGGLICIYGGNLQQQIQLPLSPGSSSNTAHTAQPTNSSSVSSTRSRTATGSSHPSSIALTGSSISAIDIPNSQPSIHDVKLMESRIKELEEQLHHATQTPGNRHSSQALDSNEKLSVALPGEAFSMYKTRMYGRSHWFNQAILFQDLFEGMEWHLREETSKSFSGIRRCQSLAKIIKSQRKPSWPLLERADLPLKSVADDLVDCYLRTTETIYRVLHVPSFKRDYDTLWISNTESNMAFVMLLKLVLAIGAVTYDDDFSLRTLAIVWIHEVSNWVARPEFKSQLNIQTLQTNLLLLIAREVVNVGGELVWISAGALYRTAIFMGLHRERNHKGLFALQMRRRLWNTILEINLQSSLLSGTPPCVSLEDFETECPSNYDDDQLLAEDSTPKHPEDFTQMSIPIALRKTFPIRLAIAKFLNDVGSSCSFERSLELDKEMRAVYKLIRQTLSNTQPSSTSFGYQVVEFLMNYYLLCLHLPFLANAKHNSTFAYSRKVTTDTSLKVFRSAVHSSSTDSALTGRDDLECFAISGSGLLRIVAFQAVIVVIVEIISQIHEDEGMGPTFVRPDLLTLLAEATTWSLRSIEVGETNIKNYMLIHIVTAQVKGLMQRLPKEELSGLLIDAAEEAEAKCLLILQNMVARGSTGVNENELNQMSLNAPHDSLEDWNIMKPDDMFDFGDIDPMSWLFDSGNNAQENATW